MKPTAVEFAVEQLEQLIPFGHQLAIRIILEQAKEMEKQNIIDAFDNGYYQEKIGYNASEQYYDETYNKNKTRMNTQLDKVDTERFVYRGKTYLIDVPRRDLCEAPHQNNKFHKRQIEFAIEQQDWVTVENRITNGLRFMWMWELDDNGVKIE